MNARILPSICGGAIASVSRWCGYRIHEEFIVMTRVRAFSRMAGLAGILVFSLSLPACQSWRDGYPFFTNRNPDRLYEVQRPTYGPDTGKPFSVGGYAGASYDPLFRRRRNLIDPGSAPVVSGAPVSVDRGAWETD
jgi:hypothetical protein